LNQGTIDGITHKTATAIPKLLDERARIAPINADERFVNVF
jgi:hypothetical protein